MKRKLIAVDLDGTMLNSRTTIHPLNIKVVKHLTELGHHVVIATGRPWRSTREFYEILGLNTPVCNYNGSFIHNPLDKNFVKDAVSIPLDMIKDIETNVGKYIANIMCEKEDLVYLQHDEKTLEGFFWRDKTDVFIGKMSEILKEDPTTIIVETSDPQYNYILEEFINKNYPDYYCRFWGRNYEKFAEIYPKHINKGNALLYVAKTLNVDPEDIIAIGDASNDIEMLSMANIGIAMYNGCDELKKVADQITKKPCIDGGLAYHFIELFGLDESILND